MIPRPQSDANGHNNGGMSHSASAYSHPAYPDLDAAGKRGCGAKCKNCVIGEVLRCYEASILSEAQIA